MLNFALGFLAALTLTLITTTTPEKAIQNLKDWKQILWRS